MNSNKECILITGTAGMVGSHLADYYHGIIDKENIIGTWFTPTINVEDIKPLCNSIECDVRNADHVFQIINQYKPTVIYHLAAQSYPTVSWEKPVDTINTNMNGTVNVFEAVRKVQQENTSYNPMIVVACSSAEYGASLTPENTPVKETAPLLPLHPYGVSKVGQDLLSFQYFKNYNIRCIRARIFNTTGARKTNDAVSDFVHRAFAIAQGANPVLKVGNLETKRAITDVRDLVQALVLLATKGIAGEDYNISGQWVYKIGDIIPIIQKELGKKFSIEVDASLLRPSDEPIIYGDSTKLKTDTGWQQQFKLEQTIQDMFNYLRGTRK